MKRYKTICVRDFDITDIDRMNLREIDEDFVRMLKAVDKSLIKPAITGLYKGEPIFIAGIFINQFNKVGDLWLACDKIIEKFWREMRHVLIDHLILHSKKVRRYQIAIKLEHRSCQTLIESMGFAREGILQSYGPNGENCLIYGRVN